MNAVLKPLHASDYAIADLSLADWGPQGTEHRRKRDARN